ncbi:MAG: hypothetical protein A2X87_06140 [Deltaproteobacteria bacterium GWC2_42_51]|nr:MAG: hypothetical protein A2067_04340 [Deltaproteobacteria bacterium GWB2_42_7]OGP36105.1 MAG: hypothetical protein A2X87_06140 [Deltaproteobacteria bacterium GWC2_42_51]OGP41966.1 MAG: hypothetical protein A2090_07055 [Deltaproteobacteria bacterium GWD2_42_10]OGP47860.1 MAG: hypothetical protein A2022_03040 [Deltaproteobacteria bacterium GWF2_42_12]OGQ28840.1 MAG: hypothetical protein A3D29_01520 [Deltaproteobacteria bacterium RIFCSPHIGHO2_02_FULL_42_44]OGQ36224.1 MAG: hypothetical protein
MGRNLKRRVAVMGITISMSLLLWSILLVSSMAASPIGGEKRPLLSPELFHGKTAYTYYIANEIPEVLDNIYCYCHCQKHSGHKSLLSCYTDKHAAFCDVCQNEAIRAFELHKEGKDIQTIKSMIDKEFER